jgi:hypothetical protein
MVVAVAVVDSMQVDSYAGLEVLFRRQLWTGCLVSESSPAGSQCYAGEKSISIHLV